MNTAHHGMPPPEHVKTAPKMRSRLLRQCTLRGSSAAVCLAGALLVFFFERRVSASEPSPAINLQYGRSLPRSPWTTGVSKVRQDTARALFLDGNTRFLDSLYWVAAQKYRQALEHWRHPVIHYNLAIALLNLNDLVAAYKNLLEALKYGRAPFSPEQHLDAEARLRSVTQRLSTIQVFCDEAGATVTLDGVEIMKGADRVSQMVLPGKHLVSVRKHGYEARDYPLTLIAGQTQRIEAKIYEKAQLRAVAQHMATIDITCTEPNAWIRLDGEPIAKGPARFSRAVMPGRHKLSARKLGYTPRDIRLKLTPGETERLDVQLTRREQDRDEIRPVPLWVPFVVSGTGVALVATGAVLSIKANALQSSYDRGLSHCANPEGCLDDTTPIEMQERAHTLDLWSRAAFAAGAVTATSGLVMYLVDHPFRGRSPEAPKPDTTFAPLVWGHTVGAAARGRF